MLDFTDISTLNRRRALHAEVSVDGQDVRLYCTHLTAMLDNVAPYPGRFDSWGLENGAQVERLLEHARQHEGPVAILGDMNTGPALPEQGIHAEYPESHARFLTEGYADPIVALGQCTYCAENTLIEDEAPSVLLDHAFVKGLSHQEGQRTRDTETQLPDGAPVNLSDHFGYAVTLSIPAPVDDAPEPPDASAEEDLDGALEDAEAPVEQP
jgi:endonuclease/exonuclease/phosphatase family metal-dependent hydrolase